MDFRQTDRNFTRPAYTCLKSPRDEWLVYRLNLNTFSKQHLDTYIPKNLKIIDKNLLNNSNSTRALIGHKTILHERM